MLLATGAIRYVGRNQAELSLYGSPRSVEFRKSCTWHRFISFSIPSYSGGLAIEESNWRPPNILDEVACVAATQLPLGMCVRGPTLSEIRLQVQKLVDESSSAQISTRDSKIPYQDLLNLLCVIMQVSKAEAPGGPLNDQSRLILSLDIDSSSQIAVAKGILEAGGIYWDSTVSFADYLTFSEKFVGFPSRRCLTFETRIYSDDANKQIVALF